MDYPFGYFYIKWLIGREGRFPNKAKYSIRQPFIFSGR